MGIRIAIDKQSCASSGRCVKAAREVVQFNADFLADLLAEGDIQSLVVDDLDYAFGRLADAPDAFDAGGTGTSTPADLAPGARVDESPHEGN